MQRARRHPGAAGELTCRPAGRRRADHAVTGTLVDRGQRPGDGGLARPGQRLDHIDRVAAGRDRAHDRDLLVAQPRWQLRQRLVDQVARRPPPCPCFARATASATILRSHAKQARRRVATVWAGVARDGTTSPRRRNARDAASTSATRAPPWWAAASSTTTWRPSKLLRCAVSPAGPARNAPTCSRSTGRAGTALGRPVSAVELVAAEPVLGRLGPHPLAPRRQRHRLSLGLARGQRRLLRRLPARPLLGLEPLDDLRPPTREVRQHPARHALELGHPVAHLAPLRPRQPLAHRRAQVRLIQRARRLGVLKDRIAMQRRPPPVRATGQVGRHHVRMQLRLTGPAHPMPVRRRHEPVRRQLDPAGTAATHPARLPLQVPERRAHRLLVRLHQRPRGLSVADREQHAHALRRREGQIQRAHPIPPRRRPAAPPRCSDRARRSAPPNASASTSPSRPSAAAPVPTQRPSTSPRPA